MKIPSISFQRKERPQCDFCSMRAQSLCDHGGCFRKMCRKHAQQFHGKHYCRDHRRKAALVASRGEYA